jgi:tellurite resistance protein TerC
MDYLHIPAWAWAATIAALVLLIAADLIVSSRRKKRVSLGEAALWAAAAIVLALAFGALLALTASGVAARQFYAGWLTEYSLSLDNLFVFVLILGRSAVPARFHGRVLMLGILLALVLRGIFIGFSAAALQRFSWVEYLFGVILIIAAVRTGMSRDAAAEPPEGRPAGAAAGAAADGGGPAMPGDRLSRVLQWLFRRGGAAGGGSRHRLATPLVILVITIGVTDVMFAFDSIPAIFGLTRDPFIVFAANMFALVGLRHLYVLVGGLLGKLAHLPAALAVILGFIGLKLIAEALRDTGVRQLGPVPLPAISAEASLAVIGGVIVVAIITSLTAGRRARRKGQAAGTASLPQPPAAGEGADAAPAAPAAGASATVATQDAPEATAAATDVAGGPNGQQRPAAPPGRPPGDSPCGQGPAGVPAAPD